MANEFNASDAAQTLIGGASSNDMRFVINQLQRLVRAGVNVRKHLEEEFRENYALDMDVLLNLFSVHAGLNANLSCEILSLYLVLCPEQLKTSAGIRKTMETVMLLPDGCRLTSQWNGTPPWTLAIHATTIFHALLDVLSLKDRLYKSALNEGDAEEVVKQVLLWARLQARLDDMESSKSASIFNCIVPWTLTTSDRLCEELVIASSENDTLRDLVIGGSFLHDKESVFFLRVIDAPIRRALALPSLKEASSVVQTLLKNRSGIQKGLVLGSVTNVVRVITFAIVLGYEALDDSAVNLLDVSIKLAIERASVAKPGEKPIYSPFPFLLEAVWIEQCLPFNRSRSQILLSNVFSVIGAVVARFLESRAGLPKVMLHGVMETLWIISRVLRTNLCLHPRERWVDHSLLEGWVALLCGIFPQSLALKIPAVYIALLHLFMDCIPMAHALDQGEKAAPPLDVENSMHVAPEEAVLSVPHQTALLTSAGASTSSCSRNSRPRMTRRAGREQEGAFRQEFRSLIANSKRMNIEEQVLEGALAFALPPPPQRQPRPAAAPNNELLTLDQFWGLFDLEITDDGADDAIMWMSEAFDNELVLLEGIGCRTKDAHRGGPRRVEQPWLRTYDGTLACANTVRQAAMERGRRSSSRVASIDRMSALLCSGVFQSPPKESALTMYVFLAPRFGEPVVECMRRLRLVEAVVMAWDLGRKGRRNSWAKLLNRDLITVLFEQFLIL